MISQDFIVCINNSSNGLTIAEENPLAIAIANQLLSNIGLICFRQPLDTFDKPPVVFNPISVICLIASKTSICLSCIPFITKQSGSK